MTADEHRAAILDAEATASAGIARDVEGLAGIHGDVLAFIESRWTRWLDARVEQIETAYYRSQGFDLEDDEP